MLPLSLWSHFHHPAKLFHLLQNAHAQWGLRPIHHRFGMFAPKSFGHVAVPAHGPVCSQGLLQLFGRNLVPLNGLALGIDQSWGMIVPVDFSERLMAVRALLPLIPPVDNRPNQAGLWRFLDLC